ncbi:SCO6880 family protein [uncultured Cellulomonas sp.]|uniref:SCO6880 family protein n=1 Tax=uncultured Cellulomonas sp. TaxID=189682 RepID=UPI0026083172|nr:SCO6880 family protein [uncultured Cellulomonas sp.]
MTTTTEQITYGNFRRARKVGLYGVPLGALVALVPLMLLLIAMVSTSHWIGTAMTLVAMGLLVAPAVLPTRNGRTLYQRLAIRTMHNRAQKQGHTLNVAGPAGRTPDGKCRLPGLLAPSELTEHLDSYGNPFGLITLPATKHHTVVIEAHATGSESVDQHVIDAEVANWGGWLALLGVEDGVVGASVTVETAPDSGLRLRRMAVGNVVPDAPQFAVAVVEATTSGTTGAPAITTRLTITFSGRGGGGVPDRSGDEVATDIGNRLPGLLDGLRTAGAGSTVRLCSAQDIVDFTRTAYDPAAALAIEEARAGEGTHLTWEEAGPIFHHDGFDVYHHDRAVSTSFEMADTPRGIFYSSVLRRLLASHRDIERKRVTLLYRPVPNPAEVVEKDINAEVFGRSGSRRQTARAEQNEKAARQAAREEAAGAGLIRFGMIVTVSCTDAQQLPKAVRAATALFGSARLKMRPALGNQAVAFAAGLPLGVVLPEHTILPTALRDAL